MTTIRSVQAVPLHAPLADVFGSARGWIAARQATLIRIETADGTIGYGECWGPSAGVSDVVRTLVEPRLVGRSPFDSQIIWEELLDKLRWAYHGFAPTTTIAGIDIALWDIRGKLLGQPIHALLGGKRHDAVRTYATGHYFPKTASAEAVIAAVEAEAVENVKSGFDAIKLKVGLSRLLKADLDVDLELLRRVRAAVGPEPQVMIDASCSLGFAEAVEVGHVAEECGVFWFEEPIDPDDFAGYRRLGDTLRVPLAAGESWGLVEQFARAAADRTVTYLQPDVSVTCGITGVARVATIASAHNVDFVPHVWGTPVAMAASLHVLSCQVGTPLFEFDTSPNPIRDNLLTTPLEVDKEGCFVVPMAPGLGVTIDEEALERYAKDGVPANAASTPTERRVAGLTEKG